MALSANGTAPTEMRGAISASLPTLIPNQRPPLKVSAPNAVTDPSCTLYSPSLTSTSGCVSVQTGLPPLAGFASEWLIYRGLLDLDAALQLVREFDRADPKRRAKKRRR